VGDAALSTGVAVKTILYRMNGQQQRLGRVKRYVDTYFKQQVIAGEYVTEALYRLGKRQK
jgi:hypothetical protein